MQVKSDKRAYKNLVVILVKIVQKICFTFYMVSYYNKLYAAKCRNLCTVIQEWSL